MVQSGDNQKGPKYEVKWRENSGDTLSLLRPFFAFVFFTHV